MFSEMYVSPGSRTGLVRDISGTWVMAVERWSDRLPVEPVPVIEQELGQTALLETAQPDSAPETEAV